MEKMEVLQMLELLNRCKEINQELDKHIMENGTNEEISILWSMRPFLIRANKLEQQNDINGARFLYTSVNDVLSKIETHIYNRNN